jgi:Tfp pilus assembly protein PilZ
LQVLTSDPEIGKFSLTARLFKLVDDKPRDQQLILLKQLIGENVSTHLFKLIVEMSEEQQIILLEQMGEFQEVETPIRTLSLEETEVSMRGNVRKPCLLNAHYKVQDRTYKNYVLDISIGGVFIESDVKFPVGKDLLLKFSLPNHAQPFTFNGKIAWSSSRGFGVKFEKISPLQSDILKSFVNEKD